MLTVHWRGKMAFEAAMDDGTGFLMDSSIESGGENKGVSPVQAFLSSAAGCSGMDVISILNKMRQEVTSYRIEVEYERVPVGTHPRPILSITLHHVLEGKDLDPQMVEKAVSLSHEKYCSVLATLKHAPPTKSVYRIE
jgi:putative redox protein